ncbi:MAG: biotin synthase BioB [Cyanobacteria bacterium J06632_3]
MVTTASPSSTSVASSTAGYSWQQLADKALAGEVLTRSEALAALCAPDEAILDQLAAAYRVRRHYWGNRVRLHFLLNAQSGLCPEDCHYCSQSKISGAEIEKYPLMATEKIMAAAERAHQLKAGTFCMAISGRSPSPKVFKGILEAVRSVKATYPMKVCTTLGLLNESQARQLKAAGVNRINHNLNTAESHHEDICTTHSFQDRRATVQAVQAAGLTTCSGGIFGMGESDNDIVDLALSLRELNVTSVPLNFLIPIPGTPFADRDELTPQRALRILCLFRLLLPAQEIRIAGGREVHLRALQPLGLYAANSIFVGDYLTTPGQAAQQDFAMIRDAGFVIEETESVANNH